MDFIITTMQKHNFRVSEDTKKMLDIAKQENRESVMIGNEEIYLHQISAVNSYEFWIEQENDRLSQKNQARCKHCDRIRDISNFCVCHDFPEKKQSILCPLPNNLLLT